MPYTTWAEVADKVDGEKLLKALLIPQVETAEDHPYFDDQVAVADRLINVELERAGYIWPLPDEPLEDAALRRAAAGIVVGLISEGKSNRQPYMGELHKMGMKYITRIGDGEVKVLGAEVAGASDDDLFMGGSSVDEAVFDIGDPYAKAHDVFADLSMPTRRRTW
jgi:hypothetical protein